MGASYVRKYSNDGIKEYAAEIVKYITVEFKKTLQDRTPWIDELTRKKALLKAEKITSQIAYAKEMLDDKILNDLYKDVSIVCLL